MELRRGVPPELIAALKQVSYPVVFIYLDWPGNPVRVHTAVGEIEWGGNTWLGVGTLADISIPPEQYGFAVSEVELGLAGVPADLDGYADDNIRNRDAEIFVGALTDRPGGETGDKPCQLVSDPVSVAYGTMDALSLTASAFDNGVLHEARVVVTTGQEARQRVTIFHSNEDQRSKHPDDTAGRLLIMSYAKAQKTLWPQN